jgi:hypothetical protein
MQADYSTLLTGSNGRAAHKAITLRGHISALKFRYTYPLQMLLAGLLLQHASWELRNFLFRVRPFPFVVYYIVFVFFISSD